MIQAIREFFIDRDYLEVETPYLIPAPAPEIHVDAIRAGDRYLHPSPELCMKRLLAAGYPRIFQISRCFRQDERGELHLPEFTLLEWYCTGIDYRVLMRECEELIVSVSCSLGFGEKLHYQDLVIELRCSWDRISVAEAFDHYGSLSLAESLKKGCFDEVMVKEIEPSLGLKKPVFLYDYPASLAALSRLRTDDPAFSERFEIYLGGIELANAFSELTDAHEQKARFEREGFVRAEQGKVVYPIPDKFLNSLKNMPDAAGIALGVDRMAMIFANRSKIDDVITFTPEEL